MRLRTFGFAFEVSNAFLRLSPAAAEVIETKKLGIAAKVSAVGPRGGVYRLVTPPDRWRESQDDDWAWSRNVTLFSTRRQGRYVHPDRVTPDLRLDEVHYAAIAVPVVEGRAILPDGRTIETASPFVSLPVLTE